jgi:hypothetical protein
MFDYESSKQEETTPDYSGTIIGAMLLPVLFIFIYMGRAELGFSVCIVLAMFIIAIKLRWKWRKKIWFWSTIIFILMLHLPLIIVFRWPQSNTPTIVYSIPMGIIDFLIITGAISVAERVFAKEVPADQGQ